MKTRGLRERHVDRVLAEEFDTSVEFSDWFSRRVFGDRLPDSDLKEATTRISYHRQDGETDVLIHFAWESGDCAVVHVEDKIGARPQPAQAERYADAVEREDSLAISALVAPSAWVRRHPKEASRYGACVSFEELAEALGKRAEELEASDDPFARELAIRLRWRQSLFDGSARRRDVNRAIQAADLDEWNEAAARVIDATNGLTLEVAPRQRSQRTTKKSRFIRFFEDLSFHRFGRQPLLQLKTASPKTPGRVSIEFREGAEDPELKQELELAGYDYIDTGAGTCVVSATTERLQELTISEPVSAQVPRLEDAATVAQGLIEWWERQPELHTHPDS